MSSWFSGPGSSYESAIDLTSAEENTDRVPGAFFERDQQGDNDAHKSGTQLWQEGIQRLHRVTKVQAKSKPRVSTAKARSLLKAFGFGRPSSPVRASSPARSQNLGPVEQKPLPSFAGVLPGTWQDHTTAAGPSSGLRDSRKQDVTLGRPHGLFNIEEDGTLNINPLPSSKVITHSQAPAFHTQPSAEKQQPQSVWRLRYVSPELPPRRDSPFGLSSLTTNFQNVRSEDDVISLISPSPPPAPWRSFQPTAIYNDTLPGLALPVPPPILRSEPQSSHVGTAANPILIEDTTEEVTARGSAAPGELALFTDGSIIGSRWGGCGVAYWKDGHWAGRAIALGRLSDSGKAEMLGIYHAYKLAVQLLFPQPRYPLVVIYTDCAGLVSKVANGKMGKKLLGDEVLRKIVQEDATLRHLGVEVRIRWVKGHSVSAGNQMADLLAGMASQKSSEGHGGQSWDDPNVGMVAIGTNQMRNMNTMVQEKVMHKRNALKNCSNKEERRARKLERRMQQEPIREGVLNKMSIGERVRARHERAARVIGG